MIVNYRNLNTLKAVETLVHEICKFLDGWGDFENIIVEHSGKQITITVEPQESERTER